MALALPHPLWSIPEVVREVMKQSAYEEDTLAQCARVSRAFSSPALEVLWQEQAGLHHLFALLPSSFKDLRVANDNGVIPAPGHQITSLVLCGEIKEEEWTRLEYYARLIRVLSCDRDRFDGLAAAMLIQRLDGRALLPRLLRLRWRQPFDTVAASLLGLFLSPTLQSVHLDLTEAGTDRTARTDATPAEYAYGTALRLIRTQAPKVEDVSLWTGVFPCSVDPLRDFDNLHELNFWQVANPALVLDVCNSLPQLEKLSLRFVKRSESQLEPTIREPLPELAHSGLTSLELDGSPAAVLATAHAIHAPSVHTLSLGFDAAEDAWKRAVALVASRFAANLRALTLAIGDTPPPPVLAQPPPPPPPFSFHAWFAPLYALRDLRSARLFSFDAPFAITAQDVDDLATGWPLLEELCLPAVHGAAAPGAEPQPQPGPGLPITAFAVLAERCPRLARLKAPVPDAAPLLEATRRVRVDTCGEAMRSVDLIGKGWPADVDRKCMKYLFKLFPEATIMVFDDDDLEDDEDDEDDEDEDDDDDDDDDEDDEDDEDDGDDEDDEDLVDEGGDTEDDASEEEEEQEE